MNNKITSRKPYIYKVTNCENHQYYIGSQCRGRIVGTNYFTSSTNKEFREGFKAHKEEKYKIEIIKEFEDPEECVRAENYIIRNYMQKRDGLCLNRFYCCNGKKVFSTVGLHHTPWNKGLKGIPRSEETKKRISTARKGIHLPEETKKKISGALKRRNEIHKPQGYPSHRRIKISISGTTFESITEASKYYNVAIETIRRWVKNKKHNAFLIEKQK